MALWPWTAANCQPPIWVWCHIIMWLQPTGQEMLPPSYKAQRHWERFISPERKSTRSDLFKEMERARQWFCCPFSFVSLPSTVDTTELYYRLITFHSFKQWLLKKFHPVACRVHTLHTLIIEVCGLFWYSCLQTRWSHGRMDHVKSTMSAKIIICAFTTNCCLPKSINIDVLIYMKSITSLFIIPHATVLYKT